MATADLEGLLPVIPDVDPFNTALNHAYYPVGTKAKMCVAQQGWTSVGKNIDGITPLVRYWTKVIDQGDGFMTND